MLLIESKYCYVDYSALPFSAQTREYQLRQYEMKKFPSNPIVSVHHNFNKTVTDYVDLIEHEKGFASYHIASWLL